MPTSRTDRTADAAFLKLGGEIARRAREIGAADVAAQQRATIEAARGKFDAGIAKIRR